MAGSVNKVILIGHLGADPDIRRNNAGDPIANMRIATSESWKDKNTGERKEKTEWHNVVIFGGVAKVAEQYLKKGMKVYVEGQLQTRKWEKDGVERYTTEVVIQNFKGEMQMLDSRNNGDGDRGSSSRQDDRGSRSSDSGRSGGGSRSSGGGGGGFGGGMDEDQIPF